MVNKVVPRNIYRNLLFSFLYFLFRQPYDPLNLTFKYPTIKLFRHGKPLKKEYRGARSVDAIKSFLLDQIRDPIVKVKSLDEITQMTQPEKRHKSMVSLST